MNIIDSFPAGSLDSRGKPTAYGFDVFLECGELHLSLHEGFRLQPPKFPLKQFVSKYGLICYDFIR